MKSFFLNLIGPSEGPAIFLRIWLGSSLPAAARTANFLYIVNTKGRKNGRLHFLLQRIFWKEEKADQLIYQSNSGRV